MSKPNTRGAADKQADDNIEQLINKVCTRFAGQLETKFTSKFDKLSEKMDSVINKLDRLNKRVDENRSVIDDLVKRCNEYEQSLRRNSLNFNGVEERDEEIILDTVLSIINNKLNIACVRSDIDGAYRMGKYPTENKSRPIRVTFVSNNKRNEVYSMKKLLKSTGINIYEDLTKPQYALFLAAKKKYGRTNTWTAGGRVYISKNNAKICVRNAEDI